MVSLSLAQWRAISVAWKSVPANRTQSEPSKPVHEHFFAGRKLWSFKVLENCVWPSNKCSAKLLEGLQSFVKTLQSCIKNQLYAHLILSYSGPKLTPLVLNDRQLIMLCTSDTDLQWTQADLTCFTWQTKPSVPHIWFWAMADPSWPHLFSRTNNSFKSNISLGQHSCCRSMPARKWKS